MTARLHSDNTSSAGGDSISPELVYSQELVIGLVGPIGTDWATTYDYLEEVLSLYDYEVHEIRISKLLSELDEGKTLPQYPEEARYEAFMKAGDDFREKYRLGSALAFVVSAAIRSYREKNFSTKKPSRIAYVIRSLKHPDEINLLREIYYNSFVCVSVYTEREDRIRVLSGRIASSHFTSNSDSYRADAERLVTVDEASGKKFGQNVRKAFPKADLFLALNDVGAKQNLERFFSILFGSPNNSPSKHEYAMYLAQAAACRSSALSRQVGAVIANEAGDILAIGTNEVPRAGGGQYWHGDENDARDFTLKRELNDQYKQDILAELLGKLNEIAVLSSKGLSPSDSLEQIESRLTDKQLLELLQLIQNNEQGRFKTTRLFNLIEFVRCVHAEMAAITDTARLGISIKGAYLYTTTFPCHECARHIISSGISKVFYIEPYPKSLALALHGDAISLDKSEVGKVSFLPFVGIAPSAYVRLFQAEEGFEKKQSDGSAIRWSPRTARPRHTDIFGIHVEAELYFLNYWAQYTKVRENDGHDAKLV